MSTHLARGEAATDSSFLGRRNHVGRAFWLIVTAALGSTACASDEKKPPQGTDDFAACVASLGVCRTQDLDTEAEMNTPCMATEFLPIPLTNGETYGPITTPGGPYGGQPMWNQGEATEFVNPVNTQEAGCLEPGGLIDLFGEPASLSDNLKNTRGLDYSLYTIFRPACMKDGEKYPVITWANGTCGLTHGYAVFLGGVASAGFVIIASNSTWTNTAPTDAVQARALDYAEFLDADSTSPLYQKLDLEHVGAMGHSQGASATRVVATDPRVDSLILWNGGISADKPFLNVSGDRDIGGVTAATMDTNTGAATQPGAWVYYHQVLETGGAFTGHLVLMEQPDRVWQMAVDWWNWQLKGDTQAKATFIGTSCGLCGRAAEFEYGHNSLLQ